MLTNNFYSFNAAFAQNQPLTIFQQIPFDYNYANNHRENADILDKSLAMLDNTSFKIQSAIFETGKVVLGMEGKSKTGADENIKGGGPRKAQLFKTEMCYNFERSGQCKYGTGCWFAHSVDELKSVPAHLPATPKISQCNGKWFEGLIQK